MYRATKTMAKWLSMDGKCWQSIFSYVTCTSELNFKVLCDL